MTTPRVDTYRCSNWTFSSHVRFGSEADMCSAKHDVRFTPNSDIDCVFRHVCFGPNADIIFDHLDLRRRIGQPTRTNVSSGSDIANSYVPHGFSSGPFPRISSRNSFAQVSTSSR